MEVNWITVYLVGVAVALFLGFYLVDENKNREELKNIIKYPLGITSLKITIAITSLLSWFAVILGIIDLIRIKK